MTDQNTLREKLLDALIAEWWNSEDAYLSISDAILPLITETVAAEIELAADNLGVDVSDNDGDYWDGYRNGQRRQIRRVIEYAQQIREDGLQ